MKNILKKYEGQVIAYTFPSEKKLIEGVLIEASDTHFSVKNPETKIRYHFNYSLILCAMDSENGLKQKGLFRKAYPIILSLYDQIVYSGAVSSGISYGFEIMF